MIATVIFAIGALIGTFTYVSEPSQVAETMLPGTPQIEPPIENRLVARVTGMAGCKWRDPALAPTSGNVFLGCKYELSSGLIEIAYATGARVVLQGPVRFEVDSDNGGFLSLGKLTARVEKGGTGAGQNVSQQALASGHATSSSLFTIKTPKAMVTDLGTEFGVEVDTQGIADVHVFSGRVRAVAFEKDANSSRKSLLVEGESLRLDPQQPLVRHAADRKPFLPGLQCLAKTTSAASAVQQAGLVANWKFDEGTGGRVTESVRGVRQRITGPAEWLAGRCGMAIGFPDAPDRAVWINTGYDLVGADADFRKHFTVSVWVFLPRVLEDYGTIADQQFFGDGNENKLPHGFYTAIERDNRAHFGVAVADRWINMNSAERLSVNQWHHLGFVYDSRLASGNLRIYVDGRPDAHQLTTPQEPLALPIGSARLRIGRHAMLKCNFTSGLDDLSFWNRALTEAELKAIYQLATDDSLNLDSQQVAELFRIFAQGDGHDATVGEHRWATAHGLSRQPGDMWTSGEAVYVQLDDAGNGLAGRPIQENDP